MRAAADAITFSWLTLRAQQFQLFQPMGGVRPILSSPTQRVNCACALPLSLVADNTSGYSPGTAQLPLRTPLSGSSTTPSGRPSTAYFMGLSPEKARRKMTGEPGRTPNTIGPL